LNKFKQDETNLIYKWRKNKMTIPKLALRNIIGAGLRTWLNVIALSFSFVVIIWTQGIYRGIYDQVERATIDALYGGGQYWQENYDPYDPLSLEDAHATIPEDLKDLIEKNEATPILFRQGTIYPKGQMRTAVLKGIDPQQTILTIPSHLLKKNDRIIPALIGSRMAKNSGLSKDDYLTIQWRDANGTFDASEILIVEIMKTNVQEIDNNQIWIPLDLLQQMTEMPDQSTIVVLKQEMRPLKNITGWHYKNLDFLLQDLRNMVMTKSVGASIMYLVLLFLAMLAIFDTQVLSIFRRKKEMGTLMALGMTRIKVIQLFTLEGTMHGILAAIVAALYGIPLIAYTANKGWAMPQSVDTFGYAIGEKIFPVYGAGLIIGTTLLVLLITTIVSFLPVRRIARLKPTDALRGKLR
jgi:ABC-type lipoprotein release transport system permease subunit